MVYGGGGCIDIVGGPLAATLGMTLVPTLWSELGKALLVPVLLALAMFITPTGGGGRDEETDFEMPL
jgi:hypothetical protein